jgi:hypothetical protein
MEGSIERDTCSCGKCLGWEESIPSPIRSSAKTTDNDQKQQQEPLSDTDKSPETEPISTDNDSSGGPDIPIRQACGAVDEKASTSGPHPRRDEPTPATKSRLWGSISQKMKSMGRKDGKRRGLAVVDLQPDEAEVVKAAGWQQETTETGISILWATEKSIAAMGLEA